MISGSCRSRRRGEESWQVVVASGRSWSWPVVVAKPKVSAATWLSVLETTGQDLRSWYLKDLLWYAVAISVMSVVLLSVQYLVIVRAVFEGLVRSGQNLVVNDCGRSVIV